MKTFVLAESIGPAGLQATDLPVPTPGPGEVLLRVQALSINPVDLKTSEGKGIYGRLKDESPLILGWDVAGIVEAVGSGVTTLQPGEEVFGMLNFPGHARAYAELVVAPAAHLVRRPASLSPAEAAAGALAALTAWQALQLTVTVQAGQRVLIHAAAGGVGHYAVQLAKHLGAYVIGTASAGKHDFVRHLGADEVIDYQQQAFEHATNAVDIVLDAVAGDTQLRSLQVLRPGGALVSILGLHPDTPAQAAHRQISVHTLLVNSDAPGMQQVADLLGSGVLRSHISLAVPFAELPRAVAQLKTGRTQGKVVVTL